ncbi:MAG: hypothetical protein MUF60_08700, partial [Vicinamibacterales bacterium]|nr:hypothetical protein [Vicinamibacterales bacterium]
MFADLHGRRVLVVGGGEVAERKVRLLREAGARVELAARELSAPELAGWATTVPADPGVVEDGMHGGAPGDASPGPVRWAAREFDEARLDGVALVVAATSDAALNERVAAAARARGLFCNVVDDAARSGFIVPAIVDRSPLVIAISSGGVAPVLARLVRERIETLIDESHGALARLLEAWRGRIRRALPDVAARRRFYEAALHGRVADLVRRRRSAAAGEELGRALAEPAATPAGS